MENISKCNLREFWEQINSLKPLQDHKERLNAWDGKKCPNFLDLVKNNYNTGSDFFPVT